KSLSAFRVDLTVLRSRTVLFAAQRAARLALGHGISPLSSVDEGCRVIAWDAQGILRNPRCAARGSSRTARGPRRSRRHDRAGRIAYKTIVYRMCAGSESPSTCRTD